MEAMILIRSDTLIEHGIIARNFAQVFVRRFL